MELFQVIRVAVYVALIFILSGICHEIGHLLACFFLKCKFVELKIWFIKIIKENKKIIVKLCFNEKEHCSFLTNSKIKMMVVMLMGPLANLLIAALFGIAVLLLGSNLVIIFGLCYNLFLTIGTLRPGAKGDGYMIYTTYKEIRSEMMK